jgi:hypothetical protein
MAHISKKSPKYPTHLNTNVDVTHCTLLCYQLKIFSVVSLTVTNIRISIYPYIHILLPCTLQGIQKYKHVYVYSCVTLFLQIQKCCRGYWSKRFIVTEENRFTFDFGFLIQQNEWKRNSKRGINSFHYTFYRMLDVCASYWIPRFLPLSNRREEGSL